jgi:hypothetical protein
MRSRFASALLVVALGFATATEALAQDSFQQQVRRYLNRAAASVVEHGYSADRDPVTGSLRSGARESMMINLTGGTRYAIVGVCDNDCTDVDLRIWDPSGTKLAEDILTDDTPILEFTATNTGQYRLSVEMATCSTNPCYWGFQVFARR